MKSSVRFKIKNSDIAHETIDGEVVIVNLKNGYYYSTDGAGATVWNLLKDGANIEEIADVLAERYDQGRDKLKRTVDEMVRELLEEGLIIGDSKRNSLGNFDETKVNGEKLKFIAPVLHKYRDMQDLLLLDPIHEVDDSGWPNAREKGANNDD